MNLMEKSEVHSIVSYFVCFVEIANLVSLCSFLLQYRLREKNLSWVDIFEEIPVCF